MYLPVVFDWVALEFASSELWPDERMVFSGFGRFIPFFSGVSGENRALKSWPVYGNVTPP